MHWCKVKTALGPNPSQGPTQERSPCARSDFSAHHREEGKMGGIKRKSAPTTGPKKAQKKTSGAHNPFEFRKNKERTSVLGKMKPASAPTGHARAHAFEIVCYSPLIEFYVLYFLLCAPNLNIS